MVEEGWEKLKYRFDRLLEFIASGYKKPPDHQKWIEDNMNTYTIVYNLCTKHEGAKSGTNVAQVLYQKLKGIVDEHLDRDVKDRVRALAGEELLRRLHKDWEAHRLLVRWGKTLFRYLDEYHTKNPSIDALPIMMLKCFRTSVYDNVRENLKAVLQDTIELERDGGDIDRQALRSAVSLVIDMGMQSDKIYDDDFQTPFLQRSAAYYRREAQTLFAEEGGQYSYLRRVEQRLLDEARRADDVFVPETKISLLATIRDQMLKQYMERVMDDPDAGCAALLTNSKWDDLGRMYRLFCEVEGGLQPMGSILTDFVQREGKEINSRFTCSGAAVEGESAGTTYIRCCIELHDKYSRVFQEHLNGSEVFHKARKAAYEVFLNPQPNDAFALKQKTKEGVQTATSSELLSLFVDGIMKKEMESEEQFDELLDKIVALFSYIHDKDLFRDYYMKQMSRRLLQSKNDHLLDQERLMISKLKMRMGNAYTSKLEGMLQDQSNADAQNKLFQEHLRTIGTTLPIKEFAPLVLTTGFWPAFKHDQLAPPEEMQICLTAFEKYYDKTTQSRKLTWMHSLGNVTIHRKWSKGAREMIVNVYQACVMLLLNNTSRFVPDEAEAQLKLPLDEVKRTLHSLAFGKYAIVKRCDGKAIKKIERTDAFEVNEDFHTNSRKFKVPAVVKNERAEVVESNQEQRRHVIEACVVRIMKSRRTLSHQELVAGTMEQLSTLFRPDPRVIKKRIEDLIQRQYLERDEDDRNQYRYLA